MTKNEKKAHHIHRVLVILITILAIALVLELSHKGLGWFSKELNIKKDKYSYFIVPQDEEELEQWDPYREMERIQRRMDRWFNRVWGSVPGIEIKRIEMFEPEVDIAETDNEYIVKCDLPGMSKDEINISVSGNYLTINGTRSIQKEEEKEKGYYYKERRSGYFKRTILLPSPVSENNVEASYNNGILAIRIQKVKSREEIKPKKVQII